MQALVAPGGKETIEVLAIFSTRLLIQILLAVTKDEVGLKPVR